MCRTVTARSSSSPQRQRRRASAAPQSATSTTATSSSAASRRGTGWRSSTRSRSCRQTRSTATASLTPWSSPTAARRRSRAPTTRRPVEQRRRPRLPPRRRQRRQRRAGGAPHCAVASAACCAAWYSATRHEATCCCRARNSTASRREASLSSSECGSQRRQPDAPVKSASMWSEERSCRQGTESPSRWWRGASEAVSLAFMSSADTSTGWLSAAAAPSTCPSQTREDPFRRSQRTILGLAHRFNARGPRKMHGSNSTSSTSFSSPAAAWMDGLSFCRPFASDEGDCVLRKSESETAGLLPFRHRSVMQTALASVVREKGWFVFDPAGSWAVEDGARAGG
mmetsp:Transcript_22445/g.63725  ORF Transcript_22445/g.63725 Transcript_22445/m.63725 type:complete len:340 (-) Transcript_22445:72-1091(-)